MGMLELIVGLFFGAMGLLMILNVSDIGASIEYQNQIKEYCQELHKPELSVENAELYEHCKDYGVSEIEKPNYFLQ